MACRAADWRRRTSRALPGRRRLRPHGASPDRRSIVRSRRAGIHIFVTGQPAGGRLTQQRRHAVLNVGVGAENRTTRLRRSRSPATYRYGLLMGNMLNSNQPVHAGLLPEGGVSAGPNNETGRPRQSADCRGALSRHPVLQGTPSHQDGEDTVSRCRGRTSERPSGIPKIAGPLW